MWSEKTLKEKLNRISGGEFRVENDGERFELALAAMALIGSTDPELRDELIYTAFCFLDFGA